MKKYTIEEFAELIRDKYPDSYDDLDDEELISLWLKKFPNDEERIIHKSVEVGKLNSPKNNNRRYWWAIGSFLIIIVLRTAINNGTLKDSDFFSTNHLKYDNEEIMLNHGMINSGSFSELYLFENSPVLESDGEPAYEGNETNSVIYMELCHWEQKNKILDIKKKDFLADIPVGKYTFKKNNFYNWTPFTITDMYFESADFKNVEDVEIISGSMDISKNEEEYIIDFQFELNNGKETSGHFEGPLLKSNY